MTDDVRAMQLQAFVANSQWAATIEPLAGDASNRRYLRLRTADGQTAVLMDAPPDKGEDVGPFISIAKHLVAHGLAAPAIWGRDIEHGFLILEDLGDALFARHVADRPEEELTLYRAAVDVLVALRSMPVPKGLPPYDATTMAPLAGLAATWYAGLDSPGPLSEGVEKALKALPAYTPVLALRDYHAENLLWLPERAAPRNVGLLDFQDARAGHPAYDLSSLLRDARRDVSNAVRRDAIQYYVAATGEQADSFAYALAVQGVQRNLRILGVFARLSLHFNKPHYVDLIPRVWDHLIADLSHPDLAELRTSVTALLPPPTPGLLQDLKARAGTEDLNP